MRIHAPVTAYVKNPGRALLGSYDKEIRIQWGIFNSNIPEGPGFYFYFLEKMVHTPNSIIVGDFIVPGYKVTYFR